MTIWKTESIDAQPEIVLDNWQIFETIKGDRHFNGYCYRNREGRVSSKIVDFDPVKKVGRTRSGRVYSLVGDRGYNGDADYVLSRWLTINSILRKEIRFVDLEDVTVEPTIEQTIKESLENASENGFDMIDMTVEQIMDDMMDYNSSVFDYVGDDCERWSEVIRLIAKYRK